MKKLLKKIKRDFTAICADKYRKSFPHIMYELIKYSLIYKDLPIYYTEHMLHRKSENNLMDYYIGKNEFKKIRGFCKDNHLVPFLENKVFFQYHFNNTTIKLPEHIGYNIGNTFFIREEVKKVKSTIEFTQLVKQLIDKKNISGIFLKPIDGNGGKGCYKIDSSQIRNDYFERIYRTIINAKYIMQVAINQHRYINEIYPLSVNTIRIHTCIDKNSRVNIISAYMRFGSKGGIVEGGDLGTIFIKVDMERGVLGRIAQKNFQYGGQIYENHPDTGFSFDGFQIPYFLESLNMVKEATYLLPAPLVGWDVAISENGPILLEGNTYFGFWAAQIADGGYKKNRVFRDFYEEISSLRP
jgi:hypothetical protein